jgi:hypothetical protein
METSYNDVSLAFWLLFDFNKSRIEEIPQDSETTVKIIIDLPLLTNITPQNIDAKIATLIVYS